ncbi:GSCOCG00002405001-RA-CDS [Cotesia congregata]|nr:GSCOCG00002405001-RA-CDS [Cotesia congregata]
MDQKFMFIIMCPDEDLCSARIRSCAALVKPSIINDKNISNSPPNPVCSLCFSGADLPSLNMNRITPATIMNVNKYFLIEYDFLPSKTPNNKTGIGLAALPTTCVG